jgi:hypothetical protein
MRSLPQFSRKLHLEAYLSLVFSQSCLLQMGFGARAISTSAGARSPRTTIPCKRPIDRETFVPTQPLATGLVPGSKFSTEETRRIRFPASRFLLTGL